MYLESNFDDFKEALFDIAKAKEDLQIQNAKEYALQREKEAQDDAKNLFEKSLKDFEEELSLLKKQRLIDIEQNYIRKRYLLRKKYTYKIKHLVQRELEEQFDQMGECFLNNLCEKYESGQLQVYKKLQNKKLEKFDLKYIEEKKIVFKQANLYVEFSVYLILREYENQIKKMILTYLGD